MPSFEKTSDNRVIKISDDRAICEISEEPDNDLTLRINPMYERLADQDFREAMTTPEMTTRALASIQKDEVIKIGISEQYKDVGESAIIRIVTEKGKIILLAGRGKVNIP